MDQALAYDEERRILQKQVDDLRNELNYLSRTIGDAMRHKQSAQAESLKAQTTTIKNQIQNLEDSFHQTGEKLTETFDSSAQSAPCFGTGGKIQRRQ